MSKYRKRPIVIEARQTGRDYDTDCEIVGWCGGCAVGPEDGYDTAIIAIDTLEGRMAVEPGDWVIRGVKGEFYPCKPDIFEATYEPVGASQENLRPGEQSQVFGEKVGTYRPWDREEKLGPPPWKPDDPKLIAWEKAHGHDVRLKCYPEFGCQPLEEQAARHERGCLMGQLGASQLAVFEVQLEALDKPTDRRRWNGGPMASKEASDALGRAVEAFQASLRADGFEIAHTGYGVTAREIERKSR